MEDHFSEVRRHAAEGGVLHGAPDYMPQSEQLQIASEQVLLYQTEVSRIHTAGAKAEAAVDELRDAVNALLAFHSSPATGEPPAPVETMTAPPGTVDLEPLQGLALLKARWHALRMVGRPPQTVTPPRPAPRAPEAPEAPEAPPRPLVENVQKALRHVQANPVPRSTVAGDGLMRSYVKDRKYDHAHVVGGALFPRHRKNKHFVRMLRDIEVKRGSLSLVLALNRQLQTLENVNAFALRKVEGRLREISGWYPRIPGPVTTFDAVEGTVMHLVKESRPYLSNGFTSRSHRNFLAKAQEGLRPVVVTEPGFPRSNGVREFDTVEYVDGIEHRRLDLGAAGTGDLPTDLWLEEFAQLAYRALLDIRPSVLHVSSGRRGYETALVALALKRKTGVPLVYEVRSFFEGVWTPETAQEEKGEIFLRRLAVEQMCMAEADVVLTLGDAMRDEIINRGTDPSKVFIVPNGVDLASFHPRPRSESLAQQWGIDGVPTFGYVSNMDHHRESQETLVRAAANLRAAGRDMRCVLVGGGPRLAKIEALAKQLGVGDKVVLTGPVDHEAIADYYSLIDVFVVPRIDERAARFVTPLKPFEAMALAKPVVVSDLPALREIVDAPNRGLVFPVLDHVSLARIIDGLFDDPDRRRSLGESGLSWVTRERQWANNGPRYREAYDRAIEIAGKKGSAHAR